MMRNLCLVTASFAITLAAAVASPASAQNAEHSTAGKLVTMSEWTGRMTRLLDREMLYSTPTLGREPRSGVVRVKFNCSKDGRPDKVTLLKGSGDVHVDREAMQAVKRMASLHPMPTGFPQDQEFEAILTFASSDKNPRLTANASERIHRNGWYKDPTVAVRKDHSKTKVATGY